MVVRNHVEVSTVSEVSPLGEMGAGSGAMEGQLNELSVQPGNVVNVP